MHVSPSEINYRPEENLGWHRYAPHYPGWAGEAETSVEMWVRVKLCGVWWKWVGKVPTEFSAYVLENHHTSKSLSPHFLYTHPLCCTHDPHNLALCPRIGLAKASCVPSPQTSPHPNTAVRDTLLPLLQMLVQGWFPLVSFSSLSRIYFRCFCASSCCITSL